MVKTLAAVIFIPLLSAQLIQVETREVAVDVTVTGKKTADLTAKDFSIWEDGKPQKINSVSSAASDPETSLKHFVLYFDFATMPVSDQAASEKAALDFAGGLASPDRYMAVTAMTGAGPRVLQDFTAAAPALKNAMMNLPSVFGNRANGAGFLPLADSLSAIAKSLSPAHGRKALLLFTGGYSGSHDSALKALISACNRANIAVYVIGASNHVAGAALDLQKRNDSPQIPQPGILPRSVTDPDTSASFAQLLADGTGGEALSLTGSLKDQLAGIAREQDEYYRVFYTPPPSKEGSCHALRVALNERGLVSKARNEYCTEKQPDIVAGKIAGQALESHEETGSLTASLQLPYFYTGTNRAVVRLSAAITPTGMKFLKDQTGLHGQLDLVGTALRSDGGTAARFADTVNIDLPNQQQADSFVHTPYRYEQQFTVAPGDYEFRLTMGAGPGTVGKVDSPLKVDPWNSAKLGIGGIAFSTQTRAVDPTGAIAPTLEGEGPLVAGGKQFIPATTNHFLRSDQIYFYTEVYDPSVDPANLRMQFRVLDAKTGEVKIDTGLNGVAGYVRPGNPVVPFATRLSVTQLPPGSYRLDVHAVLTSSHEAVVREVGFELE